MLGATIIQQGREEDQHKIFKNTMGGLLYEMYETTKEIKHLEREATLACQTGGTWSSDLVSKAEVAERKVKNLYEQIREIEVQLSTSDLLANIKAGNYVRDATLRVLRFPHSPCH